MGGLVYTEAVIRPERTIPITRSFPFRSILTLTNKLHSPILLINQKKETTMKSKPTFLLILALLTVISLSFSLLAAGKQAAFKEDDIDTLFQYSTLGSLMEGVYDGAMTFGEIKEHGDFGLGTFNALDGEMVEIDNQVYQVKSNGAAYAVDDEMLTPFAVVTFFEADQTLSIDSPMDCDTLKATIDAQLPTENIPYAVRVEGTFSYVKTRSVPAQSLPYPVLLDVLANQPTFEFSDVTGTIVGFRLPDYMDPANAPGYHFHFLNQTRDAGGHLLACQVKDVTVEIDYTDQWLVVLPEDDAFYQVEMSGDEYQ